MRSVWPWLRVLGGAAIILLLVWRLGSGAFLDGLRVLDGGTLALAFGIGILTTLLSAWRWRLVARALGMPLALPRAVADYYRALFLNAALPGGVLGDVHRAVRHGQHSGSVGRGIRAVVLERSAGQVVLVTASVIVLLVYPSPVRVHLSPDAVLLLVTLLLVTAAGLAAVLLARSRWPRAVLADVRRGLLGRRTWPAVALTSVVVVAGHLATFLLAARAAGSSASLARLVPLMLLALLAMSLPMNIGGWGPREGVCAWAFGAAGLSATQGLTTAVVYGLLAFAVSVPGAGVLVARHLVRPRAVPVSTDPVSTDQAPVPAEPVPAEPVRRDPVSARS